MFLLCPSRCSGISPHIPVSVHPMPTVACPQGELRAALAMLAVG